MVLNSNKLSLSDRLLPLFRGKKCRNVDEENTVLSSEIVLVLRTRFTTATAKPLSCFIIFFIKLEASNIFLKLVYNFYWGFQMVMVNVKTAITNHSVAIRSDTPVNSVILYDHLFPLNIKTGVRDNETI
jgi:hypothetical protein